VKTSTATMLVLAGLLAGCSSDRGPEVVGIQVPDDTSATLLTDLPAEQVANCIAAGLQTSAQPREDGYLVKGQGDRSATYRVRSIQDNLARFVTQVEQVGAVGSIGFTAASCLVPPGTGA
jgi:hypothetical protein